MSKCEVGNIMYEAAKRYSDRVMRDFNYIPCLDYFQDEDEANLVVRRYTSDQDGIACQGDIIIKLDKRMLDSHSWMIYIQNVCGNEINKIKDYEKVRGYARETTYSYGRFDPTKMYVEKYAVLPPVLIKKK